MFREPRGRWVSGPSIAPTRGTNQRTPHLLPTPAESREAVAMQPPNWAARCALRRHHEEATAPVSRDGRAGERGTGEVHLSDASGSKPMLNAGDPSAGPREQRALESAAPGAAA